MKHGSRFRSGHRPGHDPDLDGALDAMTAGELRSFLREALERLDREPRGELLDSLITRASKGSACWKPSSPARGVVGEVTRFIEAARRIGYADPHEIDDYLRQGTKAFLAGEHATAHAMFEALFSAIAYGDIDLGYHEVVDEVLAVDLRQCAAQYVTAVYLTTPLEDRAEALCRTIDAVEGGACLWEPLAQMERVATGPLPELDAFLPRWVAHLERQSPSESEWDDDRDRWLREAVLRLEGVVGLERIARKTRKPEALRAWCEALAGRGEWAEAVRACDDAAKLTHISHWQGEFLDGAALAAQQLGRRDATRRLEAAWRGAPSLVRLIRWLLAGTATASTVIKRARKAIEHCPAKAGRQLGLLHLLTGDAHAAATKRVAGILGNKRRRHYGHAAILVACCLELDPVAEKPGAIAKWVADLRRKHSRFYAFQREVDHALTEVSS